MENQQTTKEMTEEEIVEFSISNIKMEFENQQFNPEDVAKKYIEENITQKQITKFPSLKKNIFLKLSEEFPEQKTNFRKLAKRENPYIITNLLSFNNFLTNFNDEDNYKCNIFPKSNYNNLVFTPGNIGFIGARTSRGKTTAEVSIAMDALRQNKKVFFVTMEESANQLTLRFLLNILYNIGHFKNIDQELTEITNGIATNWKTMLEENQFNPKQTVLSVLRNKGIADIFQNIPNATAKFIQEINFAKEQLDFYLKEEKLTIFDGMSAPTFEEMIDTMADNDKGTICLLDYIQKVKTPKDIRQMENRFAVLKNASDKLANMTKKTNIILISGAQFGRTGNKDDPEAMDTFTDESFQECSAIEQIGEIEIGIGRQFKNGEKHSFYSILKDRDNGEYDPNVKYELAGLEKFSQFVPLRQKEEIDGKEYLNLVKYPKENKNVDNNASLSKKNNKLVKNQNINTESFKNLMNNFNNK